jgi:hypothetical protein
LRPSNTASWRLWTIDTTCESFVTWLIRRRPAIDRDAVLLERVAELADVSRVLRVEREAQRLREAERAQSHDEEQQQKKSRGRASERHSESAIPGRTIRLRRTDPT